jgi:membrane-associated protease RseP (regulator of RpoE activity)
MDCKLKIMDFRLRLRARRIMERARSRKRRLRKKGIPVFLEPTPTQFDLRFRLFGTPVRVHPTFWLLAAFLSWYSYLPAGFGFLALAIVSVFLSILVHEFGHIIMGRICGRDGHIILYGMGGLAVGEYQVRQRWQRIAISFAGPAAGFVLYGLVLFIRDFIIPKIFTIQFLEQNPTWMDILVATSPPSPIFMLLWINLVWSILNLIPIYPLDGGHISREVFSGLFPGKGVKLSLGLSFVLAGLGAIYSLIVNSRKELPYPRMGSVMIDPVMAAVMLGILAFVSFTLLQAEHNRRDPWRREG